MRFVNTALLISISFLLLCALPNVSYAHKVTIFAYVEGGKVYTESYYSDGTKCRDSLVEVFDSSGKKVFSGKTNTQGELSFVPPSKGTFKLVLHAGMGHRAETVLKVEDAEANKAQPQAKEKTCTSTKASSALQGTRYVDPKELEKILDRTLDKKLHPIMKMLVENTHKGPTARDVFAGLGYIFGLMGLVIYIRAIKKGNNGQGGTKKKC